MSQVNVGLARPYYSAGSASVVFFDRMADADPAIMGDIELYASLKAPGAQVLELGSGTGRVSHALAERGFSVVGVENAPAMMAVATTKRDALPQTIASRVEYVGADLMALDLGRRFDLILGPYFVLAHLPPTKWAGALAGMTRHLAVDGIIALHMPNQALLRKSASAPGSLVMRQSGPDGVTLNIYAGGREISANRVSLDLDYETRSLMGPATRSRERLTLYTGDVDTAAKAGGLLPAAAPVKLGEMGKVHTYKAK